MTSRTRTRIPDGVLDGKLGDASNDVEDTVAVFVSP